MLQRSARLEARQPRWGPTPDDESTALGGSARPGDASPGRTADTWPPRVWVLTCHREGDNAQMIGLAEALGWPFEIKRIVHRKLELLPNLLLRATLAGMDRRRSSGLAPPWPDLVIFAFRANENIARWIRRQSGGRTRYVLVGRPWSPLPEFDLIVTTPQLHLPERPNILHNALPLHRVNAQRLPEAAATWGPRFAALPRPRIAVLVGGSSGPYVFDRRAAERLGREASALARATGGSLLVTTSARTSAAAAEALRAAIQGLNWAYQWSKDATDNPYFGILAVADAIIVTGESISMITEACATSKPVFMFDFGGGPVPMRPPRPKHGWRRRLPWWWDWHLQTWIYALYMQLPRGRLNRTRDLRLVHRAILASGRARWLGDPAQVTSAASATTDMERAIARVRALMDLLETSDCPLHLQSRKGAIEGSSDASHQAWHPRDANRSADLQVLENERFD
jgi:mitochondrial fission protein ELM1